jgi:hypothetical protein
MYTCEIEKGHGIKVKDSVNAQTERSNHLLLVVREREERDRIPLTAVYHRR